MTNLGQILEDFSRFRDPATLINSQETSLGTEVSIVRDGSERIYLFDKKTSRIERKDRFGRKFVDFRSLLASDDFSSLSSLFDTQKRLLQHKNLDNYLDPAGVVTTPNNADENYKENLTFAKFKRIMEPKTSDKLRCILVDGPAGVGKTSLIERLVLDRARDQKSAPILHVTSRGRRLTNLRDALAGTASDLRAKFVPSEIPVLVRHNLLQVALDGFDEFVDPDGYKDAWAALKEFMKDCGSAGPLILAGRDTFFDQQKFEVQLSSASSTAEIINVRLSEVSPSQAKSWLMSNGWTKEVLESKETNNYLRPGSYILRPFFLSRISSLEGWDKLKQNHQSPQTFIIKSMLAREADILSAPLEIPTEVIIDSLEQLFETIAEDMADREVDSVPLNYLNFVAEVAFSNVLSDDKSSRLKHSLGSLALLEVADDGEAVRFPHSEIQNRFLVRYIIRTLSEGKSPHFLGRIIFALDRMEAFSERMLEISEAEMIQVVGRIRKLLYQQSHNARFTENLASMYLSSLIRPHEDLRDCHITDLYANDVRIIGEYNRSRMENVQIARLDIRDADISDITFESSQVSVLIANSGSKIGATVPKIGIVQFENMSLTKTLRSKDEIAAWIRDYSSGQESGETEEDRRLPLLKHFDRVCRRFLSQTYIRNSVNDDGSYLLRGTLWELIRGILEKHDRLSVEAKDTAGKRDEFFYVENPLGLLNPADESDSRVREDVLKLAKTNGP